MWMYQPLHCCWVSIESLKDSLLFQKQKKRRLRQTQIWMRESFNETATREICKWMSPSMRQVHVPESKRTLQCLAGFAITLSTGTLESPEAGWKELVCLFHSDSSLLCCVCVCVCVSVCVRSIVINPYYSPAVFLRRHFQPLETSSIP